MTVESLQLISCIHSYCQCLQTQVDYYFDETICSFLCKQISGYGNVREDTINIFQDSLSLQFVVEVRRMYGDGLLFEVDEDIIDLWSGVKRALQHFADDSISQVNHHFFDGFFDVVQVRSDQEINLEDRSLCSDDLLNPLSLDRICIVKSLIDSPNLESNIEGAKMICQVLCRRLKSLSDIRSNNPDSEERVVINMDIIECKFFAEFLWKILSASFLLSGSMIEENSAQYLQPSMTEESKGNSTSAVNTRISFPVLLISHEIAIIALEHLLKLVKGNSDIDWNSFLGSSFGRLPILINNFEAWNVEPPQKYVYAAVTRSIHRIRLLVNPVVHCH